MTINTPKLREIMRKNGIKTMKQLAEILDIKMSSFKMYLYTPHKSPWKTDELARQLAELLHCDLQDIAVGEEHKTQPKQAKRKKKKNTLCWKCRNAVPDYKSGVGCEWSRYFKPVPGWTAERGDISIGKNKRLISYCVIDCPKFERG